jgi:hypothetical protein
LRSVEQGTRLVDRGELATVAPGPRLRTAQIYSDKVPRAVQA